MEVDNIQPRGDFNKSLDELVAEDTAMKGRARQTPKKQERHEKP